MKHIVDFLEREVTYAPQLEAAERLERERKAKEQAIRNEIGSGAIERGEEEDEGELDEED